MSLSRELRRRLLLEDEPLAKRLKLAENVFASTDLRVTKKEDLVIKWLCRVSEENPDEVVWRTMKHCLEFKNTSGDIVLKSEVKQSLVRTLMAKLTNIGDSRLDDVLGCCDLLFANCEMQQYFQSKPESLAEFMKALFESKTSEDASSIHKCAADAVNCFVACYKQSSKKDEFADEFIREILYPVCGLIDKNQNDRLGAEIHKCIQQLLFGKSRYTQFKAYDENDEKNFGRKLFVELRKKNAAVADEEIVIVVFVYVFRAAVSSYKADPSVIDVIFRNLIDSAGHFKVKLLTCLRDQLANITFDFQNKIGDSTLFGYLEKFIDEILSADRLVATDYEAIAVIALLNPLIIEAKLQGILKRILLEKKNSQKERDSYGKLMITILEAEVRLRREQKLVPWMLTAVKQSIADRGKNDLETDEAFPIEFKDRFSKSVSNMTTMQTTDLLRSLIFHLKSFCNEDSENCSKITMTFLLRATVDLIVAYFKGVRIYDHSVPLAGQQKFVLALNDFGKAITILTDTVVSLKHNKKIIVSLLTVTWYWDNVLNLIKYYVPDAISKTPEFPISNARIKELRKSDNSGCKRAMNRICLQQMGRNLEGDGRLDVSELFEGLEASWSIIIDENPHIVSSMDNSQVAELARLLLEDLKSSEGECSKSMQRLKTENIQNDVRLVTALVCQTFANIAVNLSPSTTKSIVGHVNVVKILNSEKLSKVLKGVKKEYEKNEWIIMDGESTSTIEHDLQSLSCLPLNHLGLELRTLILLIVYAIKQECENNKAITDLCTQIMLDVLEKNDIEIFDYIEPSLLMKELPRSLAIQRVVVSSLRNVSSWETLKGFVKKSEGDKETVAALLDCMEKVKPKFKGNQKELFKKAEHKLSKKLLDDMEAEMTDHKEVRRLTKALKVPVADNEIPGHLVDVVKSTLVRVFVSEASIDETLVAEGFQLVKVVLTRPSKFELSEHVLAHIWPWFMKNPSKELVSPLLQASKSEAMLSKVLALLYKQTISGLTETDGSSFSNALLIWDAIMNVDMGPSRNKLRIAAILNILETLLISRIPNELWPGVLKLVQSTFSKHAYAVEQDIDVMLLLAARSLKEVELSACEDVLLICHSLMTFEADFITDRLPILLLIYGQLVSLIVQESRKNIDSSRERQLRCLALDVLKFTIDLVKLKKHLYRISPYVIAGLVEIFSEGVIPSCVKGSLEESIGHILSACDHHAISLLSRALPTATQGIFKTLYETYSKFYKFTGKI